MAREKVVNFIPFTADSMAFDEKRRAVYSDEHHERLCKAAYKHIGDETRQDTGVFGRQYEPHVRGLLMARGLYMETDVRCRNSKKHDCIVYINGHKYIVEIKTGAGVIATAELAGLWYFNGIPGPESCFIGADLIVYCAEPDKLASEQDIMEKSVVMTRADFLRFIVEQGPKRKKVWESAVKGNASPRYAEINRANKQAGNPERLYDTINIQGQNLDNLAAAIRQGIRTGELESLRRWLERNGRK